MSKIYTVLKIKSNRFRHNEKRADAAMHVSRKLKCFFYLGCMYTCWRTCKI